MEPAHAHSVFPCFDQPNLKATFKLTVSAPEFWSVISNGSITKEYRKEDSVKQKEQEINSNLFKIPDVRKFHSLFEFEETIPLPTYSFAVCAGPFYENENFLDDKADKLPTMTIYCRSSIYKSADCFSIFKTAKNVFLWFKENLTSNIPMDKLSLVFLPNLKPCAMENHGCITFNDDFLEPSHTSNYYTYINSIIAHEIVHTWFGNWITPEWWDDLWLNESFATFLSYLCLKQISENKPDEMEQFNTAWLLFNNYKAKAIIYDQYKTTHKITEVIEDISHAEIAFDNITYYKGAAILKYFYYVCGHELFFKASKIYVDKFKNKNANYEDFKEILKSLSETRHIQTPISTIEPFLENVGVTRLEPEIVVVNNKIEEFKVYQNICQHATPGKYYNHRLNVLFLYNNGTEQVFNEVQLVDNYESRVEILEKLEKPSAIVLNHGDWAYFKQTFDDSSREYLIENTYRIKDPVTRLVVSRDLSEMIKDGLFDVEGYIEFTTNLLRHEKESHIVEQVLRTAIHMVTHFVLFDKQNDLKQRIFNLIETDLFHKHRFIKKTLINFMIDLIDFTHSKEIKMLITLLSNEKMKTNFERGYSETLENFNTINSLDMSFLDEKTKFRLLHTIRESVFITESDKKHFEEIIMAIQLTTSRSMSKGNISVPEEKFQDGILSGESLEQLTLDACSPDKEHKEKLWEILVNRSANNYVDNEYAAIMKGFARKSQYPILKEYFESRFFENFPEVLNYQGEEYALMFFKYLAPTFIIREDILKSFIRLGKFIRYNDHKLKKFYEKSKSSNI